MSDRALKQLVGALALAVAVWLITLVLSGGSGGIGAAGEIATIFDDVSGPALSAAHLEGPDGSVLLARSGETWTANGYRADQAVITTFLSAVTSASVGDLIATNPSNHARMGVDEGSAIRATFTTGGGDRTILIGQSGRRFQTAYVRAPGDDDVYLLEGRLASEVRKDEAAWRDRTMVSVDSTAVVRIVVSGDENYAFVRGDSTWTVEGRGAADPTAVAGILAELSRLDATGFLSDSDSIAQLPESYTTRALAADGTVLAEITIGAGEGDRWGRVATDDYLYRVSAFRAERLGPASDGVTEGG